MRAETNVGVTGVGEATLSRTPRTIEAAIEEERDRYLGESPLDAE